MKDVKSFIFEFINCGGRPVISKWAFSQNTISCFATNDDTNPRFQVLKDVELTFDNFSLFGEIAPLSDKSSLLDITPRNTLTTFCGYVHEDCSGHGPLPMGTFSFTAPIRSRPRKTYDEPATPASSEGGHIPYELRKLFKTDGTDVHQNLIKYGENSGMFNDIVIKNYGDDSSDAPFRLGFVLDNEPINIINTGYGISQVLPIIYDAFAGRANVTAIQQPEIHLHPKAQAALGDVFFNVAQQRMKRLLIETHSDYIIDRFRWRQKKSDKKVQAQVLFFARKDGRNIATSIPILDSGLYPKDQPREFREFFVTETMRNLEI
jgi:hypothetical protein